MLGQAVSMLTITMFTGIKVIVILIKAQACNINQSFLPRRVQQSNTESFECFFNRLSSNEYEVVSSIGC